MDRLTYKGPNGHWMISGYRVEIVASGEDCISGPAIDRLAAYEDAMPLERAQELALAEKDGRLVVLPTEDYTFKIRGDIAIGLIKANCRAANLEEKAALEGENNETNPI